MDNVRESDAASLRSCAERVESCEQAPAGQAKQSFGSAMTEVIAVRNAWLRADAPPGGQATLRRLNALLSLMASVEFPLSGFHRDRLGGVARELRAVAGMLPA